MPCIGCDQIQIHYLDTTWWFPSYSLVGVLFCCALLRRKNTPRTFSFQDGWAGIANQRLAPAPALEWRVSTNSKVNPCYELWCSAQKINLTNILDNNRPLIPYSELSSTMKLQIFATALLAAFPGVVSTKKVSCLSFSLYLTPLFVVQPRARAWVSRFLLTSSRLIILSSSWHLSFQHPCTPPYIISRVAQRPRSMHWRPDPMWYLQRCRLPPSTGSYFKKVQKDVVKRLLHEGLSTRWKWRAYL